MDLKSGIIFASGQEEKGTVDLAQKIVGLKLSAKVLGKGGMLLVALAARIGAGIFWPILAEEVKYSLAQTKTGRTMERLANVEVKVQVNVAGSGEVRPDWIVPDSQYSIYIPKIWAKSKVIADVNAGNSKEYLKALKQGVAEAAGLAHPGEKGTTYLFAHSVGSSWEVTRYNAIFYLLDKLVKGDRVEVVYKNKLYKYQVADREVIASNDVKYMQPQKNEEKLVLQTCYPPGTTWRRLIVVAKRV